jgi:hypothetical protein
LSWDANKEPDVTGYEIVWRDTTDATWTHSQAVGNVKTFTMKGMSKDNYFFGVRAVDKQGNRSPATYPHPAARQQPQIAVQRTQIRLDNLDLFSQVRDCRV